MGLERQRNADKDPRISIQKPLALLAAGFSPEESDREKRNRAMQEWVEHYAQPFREYVDTHPDIKLDPSDTEGMQHLLEEIRTLH